MILDFSSALRTLQEPIRDFEGFFFFVAKLQVV